MERTTERRREPEPSETISERIFRFWCDHQHFNSEPGKPAEWLAFIFNPFIDALGNERVQVIVSPDYKGAATRLGTTLPHAG